jgi:outer membrane protein assembly factor BamA
LTQVRIHGLKKTHPEVILREMTIQQGDTIPLDKWEAIQQECYHNIYNTAVFTKVELQDTLGPGGMTLDITVQERWYIWPTPYVNLEERTFNEWWQDKDLDRLVYGMGVTWDNFSGWRDQLIAYAQLGYSRRVTLAYSRPFLFPKPKIDGVFYFRYLNNKEIGYGTEDGILQLARLRNSPMRVSYEGMVRFGKRYGPRKRLYLDFAWNYFEPDDSIVYFNPEYLTTAARAEYYPSVTLTWVSDQRDLFSFPLSGYKYGALVRQSGLPGWGTTRFTKVSLTFSQHLAITRRWNFAWGVQQMFTIGDRVPYFDKFFVGFENSLRGFEPYVIDAGSLNLSKVELKYGIIPRQMLHVRQIPFRKFRDFPLGIYLSGYADAGYVSDATFNNNDRTLKNIPLIGYGVGLNFITVYDALLRVEYSRNNLGGQGIYLHGTVSIR